jgi:DNA polymerase-3 subunit delta'
MSELSIYPWQQSALRELAASAEAGRLGHAWLLAGPRGTGRRRFAATLALLLARGVPPGDWSSTAVTSDTAFDWPSHPDLHLAVPEEGKRTIGVDRVREVIAGLGLTGHGGHAKVAVVEPAEQMTASAANSLLKTLEEPPGASFLLLVTAAPGRLPATIRSRCQRRVLGVPSTADALGWLAATVAGSDDQARRAALALSRGAPVAAAIRLREGLDEKHALWSDALAGVLSGRDDGFGLAARLLEDEGLGLEWLELELETLIRARLGAASEKLALAHPLAAIVPRLDPRTLFEWRARVAELAALSGGGVNLSLNLEALITSWTGRAA